MHGRVGSLLEVGTGFHPELTGRENVYLSGAILGMSRKEIDRKFDEIVDFSGVEKYIDTPVKRYSSGMRVRLGFAVAAHLEPEILLIDEVLAVGDAEFRKKCLGKMSEVAGEGRTVVFVSHSMAAVRSLCKVAMLLRTGHLAMTGDTEAVIAEYLGVKESSAIGERVWRDNDDAPGDEDIRVRAIRIRNSKQTTLGIVSTNEDIYIEIEYQVLRILRDARVGFQLLTTDGTVVLSSGDGDKIDGIFTREPGLYRSRCRIPNNFLNSGTYTVRLSGHIPGVKLFFSEEVLLPFTVVQTTEIGGHGRRPGVIRPLLEWQNVKLDETCT